MAQELENKKSLPANVDDRQLVYVRYEGEDEEELGFYDIMRICDVWGRKILLTLKRYIAFLLALFIIGGVVGYVKAKTSSEMTYTSDAVLFIDLNRDMLESENDTNEAGKISMLASSFSEIVRSDAIITPIAKQYAMEDAKVNFQDEDALLEKIDDLRNSISVWTPGGTQIIRVSVTVKVPNGEEDHAQEICESVVEAGISSLDSVTDYATIKVISAATEARKEKGERALTGAINMAGIFLALALVVVVIREMVLAYKTHEAAVKTDTKEKE